MEIVFNQKVCEGLEGEEVVEIDVQVTVEGDFCSGVVGEDFVDCSLQVFLDVRVSFWVRGWFIWSSV